MELGGNAPFLVFEDADLDAAVDGAMLAKMRNVGEACTAANRFHVHESVAEEFAARLAERMAALKRRPRHRGGCRGRAADRRRPARQGRRARRRRGGPRAQPASPAAAGARRAPATSTSRRCSPASRPTPGCSPRRSSDRSRRSPRSAPRRRRSRRRTSTEFGLVSYVFTRDLERAFRVCEALETGMIGLNQGLVSNAGAPFGGVKQSGTGREGGNEGIAEYLETKYVAVNL